MNLELRQRMVLECDCCTGHSEEHDTGCPRGEIRALYYSLHGPGCPVCHKLDCVYVNKDDYYECSIKTCRALFSRSEIVAGFDPDKLERLHLLDYNANTHFPVLRIPGKGKGVFPHTIKTKELQARIKKAKRFMRQARKARDG